MKKTEVTLYFRRGERSAFVDEINRIIDNDLLAVMNEHDEQASFKAVSTSSLFAETGQGNHAYIKGRLLYLTDYLSLTSSVVEVRVANVLWKFYWTRDQGRIVCSILQQNQANTALRLRRSVAHEGM